MMIENSLLYANNAIRLMFFSLIIFSSCTFFAIKANAKVEIVTFRGWENCYKISNAESEVIINPESGGRVMWFSLKGKNIIYQDSTQNGKLYKDWITRHFDPDGGRFDYGPELEVSKIHQQTYMGKWTATINTDYSISIKSPADTLLGLQSERLFVLDSRNAQLKVIQKARNISDKVLVRHFWSRTLVHLNGVLSFDINPKSYFKAKYGTFIFNNNRDIVDTTDSRIKIINNKLYYSAKSPSFKFGADIKNGSIKYQVNQLSFEKKYKIKNLKRYTGSDNMSIIIYNNDKFLEIEPVSITHHLKPGQKMRFQEEWRLY